MRTASNPDQDPVPIDLLLRTFADGLGADAALVVSWDEDQRDAEIVARLNLDEYGTPDLDRARTFLGNEKSAVFGPALAWARASGDGDGDGRPHIAYISGAPIKTPTGARGALLAGFVGRPPVSEKQLLWLNHSYAAATGLCLHEQNGLGELLDAASHDVLTGCLNYRGLTETLAREISRAERNGGQLSCCFLDLDAFGDVNVTEGHMRGNEVLAAFGEALRGNLRRSDCVGRFGGDEFIIVMPGAGPSEAVSIVRRLRAAAVAVTREATHYPLQVSAGIASWSHGMSIRGLLDAADEAILEAKSAGEGLRFDSGSPVSLRPDADEDPAPA